MSRALLLVGMTFRQTLGWWRLVRYGAGIAAPAVIFFLVSGQLIGDEVIETFVGISIGVFYSIALPVVSLVIAASALGDERRDATLSFIVLRPISRYVIAGSKLSGAFVAAFAYIGVGAFALALAMGLRSGDWSYVVPTLVASFIATAVYVLLFVPLGYLTERATLIGLAFVFIWESAIAGTIPGLAGTSPWRIGFSAFLDLAPEGTVIRGDVPDFAIGDLAVSTGSSLMRLIVIAVLSVGLTSWILRRRDLV